MGETATANTLFTQSSVSGEEEVIVPDDLNPDQVGDFVAPLSEQQVRALLINNLEQEALIKASRNSEKPISVLTLLSSAGDPDSQLGQGIRNTIAATQTIGLEVTRILNIFTPGAGVTGFIALIGYLFFGILVGFGAEWYFLKRQRRQNENVLNEASAPTGSPLSTLMINLCGLLIFSIVSYLVIVVLAPDNELQTDVVMRFYGAVLFYRLMTILFKLAVFPATQGFGLIDSRIDRVVLYRCMAAFAFSYIFGTEFVLMLMEHGLPIEHTVLGFMFLFGAIVNPIVYWFVWTQREDIDRIMFGSMNENELRATTLSLRIKSHYLAVSCHFCGVSGLSKLAITGVNRKY